mmetsp:Transcript_15183/g.21797  ORF Transcript_15183/g.21797 Transcript_15183/m.21797 type:complete len:221 (+) Transcript_15183:685-1347(+)
MSYEEASKRMKVRSIRNRTVMATANEIIKRDTKKIRKTAKQIRFHQNTTSSSVAKASLLPKKPSSASKHSKKIRSSLKQPRSDHLAVFLANESNSSTGTLSFTPHLTMTSAEDRKTSISISPAQFDLALFNENIASDGTDNFGLSRFQGIVSPVPEDNPSIPYRFEQSYLQLDVLRPKLDYQLILTILSVLAINDDGSEEVTEIASAAESNNSLISFIKK